MWYIARHLACRQSERSHIRRAPTITRRGGGEYLQAKVAVKYLFLSGETEKGQSAGLFAGGYVLRGSASCKRRGAHRWLRDAHRSF